MAFYNPHCNDDWRRAQQAEWKLKLAQEELARVKKELEAIKQNSLHRTFKK